MSLKIRLKRTGSKKRPFYRVVVTDSRKARDSRSIEDIGYYNPLEDPVVVNVDREKVDHWVGLGAQFTDTVKSLLKHPNSTHTSRRSTHEFAEPVPEPKKKPKKAKAEAAAATATATAVADPPAAEATPAEAPAKESKAEAVVETEAAPAEAPAKETAKAEAPAEEPKAEEPKAEEPKAEEPAPAAEPTEDEKKSE